jgi:GABA(A) receptor-associated protein
MVRKSYVSFFQEQPVYKRIEMSRRLEEKYPDRCCVIIDRGARGGEVPAIEKHKYLVPKDLTFAQFSLVIRKQLQLPAPTAVFFFVNDKSLPQSSALMSTIHERCKSEDGFLYMTYNGENTFG